jgi:23S rRNA pseudouridine1911/1915/1917 synthase
LQPLPESSEPEPDLDEVEIPSLSISEPVSLTVEARAHGWRVDHYLARLFPNYSRELFQKAIEQSAVQVNGLAVKASRRLRVNDRLSVRLPELPDHSLEPEDLPIQVVYEDDAIAIINKPSDMVTHPGKGNFKGTLAAAVQFHFNQAGTAWTDLATHKRLYRDESGAYAGCTVPRNVLAAGGEIPWPPGRGMPVVPVDDWA